MIGSRLKRKISEKTAANHGAGLKFYSLAVPQDNYVERDGLTAVCVNK